MVAKKPSLAVIGAGRVGSVLAAYLMDRGYPLVGVGSRTEQSAARLGNRLKVPWSTNGAEIASKADLVIVCTPDSQVEPVVQAIAAKRGFWAGQYVFHTSGALSLTPLAAAAEIGAFTGSLHPLQSFTDDPEQELPAGTYFAIDGGKEAARLAASLVIELEGVGFTVPAGERGRYHAAACMASNYLVSLLHCAARLLDGCGLTEREALQALAPLLKGTLDNVSRQGTGPALTGPIRRGDAATVRRHMEALQAAGDIARLLLYRALGLYTLQIAERQAGFSEDARNELITLLNSNGRNENER